MQHNGLLSIQSTPIMSIPKSTVANQRREGYLLKQAGSSEAGKRTPPAEVLNAGRRYGCDPMKYPKEIPPRPNDFQPRRSRPWTSVSCALDVEITARLRWAEEWPVSASSVVEPRVAGPFMCRATLSSPY